MAKGRGPARALSMRDVRMFARVTVTGSSTAETVNLGVTNSDDGVLFQGSFVLSAGKNIQPAFSTRT